MKVTKDKEGFVRVSLEKIDYHAVIAKVGGIDLQVTDTQVTALVRALALSVNVPLAEVSCAPAK